MIMQRRAKGMTEDRTAQTSRGRSQRRKIRGVVVGVLVGVDELGVPHVDYPGNRRGILAAKSTVRLSADDVDREIGLMFEEADPDRPLILGVIEEPVPLAPPAKPIHATIDGETVTITAESEIVFQCGKASITLSRDGKIQIRGAYLVSRSSGVNRIQGGSIELN